MARIVAFITGMILSSLGWAQEHDSCSRPLADYSSYAPKTLNKIAASCKDAAVAELFYNRATLGELGELDEVYSRLIPYRPKEDQHHFDSYQIFVAMVELLSIQRSKQSNVGSVSELNKVYEIVAELARMRFKGYDLQANALEREAWSDNWK